MFDPVGLSAELQEPSMVDDAVDDGGSHVVVAEHQSSGEGEKCLFVTLQ